MSALDNVVKSAYRNAVPHEHQGRSDEMMRGGMAAHLYLHHGVPSTSDVRSLDAAQVHAAHDLSHVQAAQYKGQDVCSFCAMPAGGKPGFNKAMGYGDLQAHEGYKGKYHDGCFKSIHRGGLD